MATALNVQLDHEVFLIVHCKLYVLRNSVKPFLLIIPQLALFSDKLKPMGE